MSVCPEFIVEPTGTEPSSYARGLHALVADGVPFLVGGGLALAAYCGIRRTTKDVDIFTLPAHVPRVLDVLDRAGFRTETTFPHWLAKAHSEAHFIDVIFSSGNGAAVVDREWFEHAPSAAVLGVTVRICPVEETIWTKAFVMERERFDGADVVHLLLARAREVNWERLLRRFAEDWRVLFAHLVLFGYVFPDEAERVPRRVTEELSNRVRRPGRRPDMPEGSARICRGTLLSREQYLPDLARGWRDARLEPHGSMSTEAIALWTRMIG